MHGHVVVVVEGEGGTIMVHRGAVEVATTFATNTMSGMSTTSTTHITAGVVDTTTEEHERHGWESRANIKESRCQ